MRIALFLTLGLALLGACGGSAEAPATEVSTVGDEVPFVEPMLPLEAYLSPGLDYVAVDLEQVRRHPFAGALLEDALASLEASSEPSGAEVAEALRRTSRVLALGSVEEALSGATQPRGWVFGRGDYAGFEATTAEPGRVRKLGDHTLVVSEQGTPSAPAGDPGERLDAAIVARVDVGDAARANLAGVPASATVHTAERARLRIALGEVISIEVVVEHRDDPSAQGSLDELQGMLLRVRPLMLLAPKVIRRLAEKLVLLRDGRAVVARLDLTEADVRELGELAAKVGVEALIQAGEGEPAPAP